MMQSSTHGTTWSERAQAQAAATELQSGELDNWTYTVEEFYPDSEIVARYAHPRFRVALHDEEDELVAYWGQRL